LEHVSLQTIECHEVEGVKNWESKDKMLKSLAEYVSHDHKSNEEIRYEIYTQNLKQFIVSYKGTFNSTSQTAEEM
jgi:hypothetical protein